MGIEKREPGDFEDAPCSTLSLHCHALRGLGVHIWTFHMCFLLYQPPTALPFSSWPPCLCAFEHLLSARDPPSTLPFRRQQIPCLLFPFLIIYFLSLPGFMFFQPLLGWRTGFKPVFCCLQAVWLWMSILTSLSFNIIICKVEIISTSLCGCVD